MNDLLNKIAAGLLELPEEAAKLMGEGLSAVGAELEKLAARIDALEEKLKA